MIVVGLNHPVSKNDVNQGSNFSEDGSDLYGIVGREASGSVITFVVTGQYDWLQGQSSRIYQ